MKTKEELETRIKELTVLIEESSGNVKKLVDEQNKLTKELEDFNKPKLSNDDFSKLTNRIEDIIDQYDFDDVDNYECDFEIDYDNRIQLQSISFDNQSDLTSIICEAVDAFFNIQEDESTDSEQ
jgi:mevalonate kinase